MYLYWPFSVDLLATTWQNSQEVCAERYRERNIIAHNGKRSKRRHVHHASFASFERNRSTRSQRLQVIRMYTQLIIYYNVHCTAALPLNSTLHQSRCSDSPRRVDGLDRPTYQTHPLTTPKYRLARGMILFKLRRTVLSRTVCKAHLKSHLFPISCRTRANAMHECAHIRRAIYATLHYRWLTGFNAHPKTFIFYLVHGTTMHLRWHGSTNTVHARSGIDERWLVAWTLTAQARTCNPPHSCGFTLSGIPMATTEICAMMLLFNHLRSW